METVLHATANDNRFSQPPNSDNGIRVDHTIPAPKTYHDHTMRQDPRQLHEESQRHSLLDMDRNLRASLDARHQCAMSLMTRQRELTSEIAKQDKDIAAIRQELQRLTPLIATFSSDRKRKLQASPEDERRSSRAPSYLSPPLNEVTRTPPIPPASDRPQTSTRQSGGVEAILSAARSTQRQAPPSHVQPSHAPPCEACGKLRFDPLRPVAPQYICACATLRHNTRPSQDETTSRVVPSIILHEPVLQDRTEPSDFSLETRQPSKLGSCERGDDTGVGDMDGAQHQPPSVVDPKQISYTYDDDDSPLTSLPESRYSQSSTYEQGKSEILSASYSPEHDSMPSYVEMAAIKESLVEGRDRGVCFEP